MAKAAAEADDEDDDDDPDDADADDDSSADDDDAPNDADEDDDTGADIAARVADLAGQDPDALQAAHDALVALGATCDPDNCADADKTVTAGDLAKLDGGALVEAVLAKALPRMEALERRLESQAAIIERLASLPLPPKTAASGHARPIGKAEDADPATGSHDLTADEAQKAFAALTPDERALILMKAALRQPISVG
jgi:hypothetical protein